MDITKEEMIIIKSLLDQATSAFFDINSRVVRDTSDKGIAIFWSAQKAFNGLSKASLIISRKINREFERERQEEGEIEFQSRFNDYKSNGYRQESE